MPLERPPVGHYERWLLSRGNEEEMIALCTASDGTDTEGAAQTWHSALPEAWHSSTWLGERTLRFLDERDPAKPFCAWISFPDPHQPFDCPVPWSKLHDPRDVPLPQTHGEDPTTQRPWWYKATLEGTPALSVRTKTHKATFELASGAGELYDLVNDPLEKVNRFDDPACASIRKELHDLMRERPGKIAEKLAEPIGMA